VLLFFSILLGRWSRVVFGAKFRQNAKNLELEGNIWSKYSHFFLNKFSEFRGFFFLGNVFVAFGPAFSLLAVFFTFAI
jgi:hypothetical protein